MKGMSNVIIAKGIKSNYALPRNTCRVGDCIASHDLLFHQGGNNNNQIIIDDLDVTLMVENLTISDNNNNDMLVDGSSSASSYDTPHLLNSWTGVVLEGVIRGKLVGATFENNCVSRHDQEQ